MKKEDLKGFLAALMEDIELYSPMDREGRGYIYEKIEDAEDIDLDPGKPMIPLKYFFHPPRFKPYSFDGKGYYESDRSEKKIVFGAHPCDINGTLILDKLFMQGDFPDNFYRKRRENTYVIGLSCMPDETCFCKSTNTHIVEEGFDIFFSDIGDWYIVWVATSKGDDLVHYREELFSTDMTQEDMEAYTQWHKERDEAFQLSFDMTAIPDKVELNYDADFWDVLGDRCLSCGQCTMVCPSCNCFNLVDELLISKGTKGRKKRYWDSCMFENYSVVAGGENFRETKGDRVRLWYTHKLKGFNGQFGKYACVGCGRCIDTCPVDINVKSVMEHIHGQRCPHESLSPETKECAQDAVKAEGGDEND